MLPKDLLNNFADSQLSILRWDPESYALVVEIAKEIGPERGELTFHTVAHICIPSSVEVASMRALHCQDICAANWPSFLGPQRYFGVEHIAYFFEYSWGGEGVVVAEGVTYIV